MWGNDKDIVVSRRQAARSTALLVTAMRWRRWRRIHRSTPSFPSERQQPRNPTAKLAVGYNALVRSPVIGRDFGSCSTEVRRAFTALDVGGFEPKGETEQVWTKMLRTRVFIIREATVRI